MKAHPTTRYAVASPQTWTLIRGAYLSGLSAPTVAARFGVTESTLRKHAAREGWTKRAFAATRASPWAGPPPTSTPPSAPPSPPPDAAGSGAGSGATPGEDEVVDAWTAPLHIRPGDLARRALANAAHALKTGQGLNAVRLARAASEIARLDALFEWAEEDPAQAEARFRANQEIARLFLRAQALTLAKGIVEGRGLPPEYQAVEAAQARDAEILAADAAAVAAARAGAAPAPGDAKGAE